MAESKILVVEDERDIAELLSYNLRNNRYLVTVSSSGEDCLRLVDSDKFDLILLDLMLPGLGGLEICRRLKADTRTSSIPIIMLTAMSEEADIIAGLEIGAVDYVTKPFSLQILLARIKAALRRGSYSEPRDPSDLISVLDLEIDLTKFRVSQGGKDITLTRTEFGLLSSLARRPGVVFTRNQLVDLVIGEDAIVTDRTIDVHIAGLRKKLSGDDLIETVRGIGYRFREKG